MLSTGGMLDHVARNPDGEFIVATENGMLHPLQQAAPGATLIEANRMAFCKYMKMITLPKLRDSLRETEVRGERPGGGRRAGAAADRAHGRDRLAPDIVPARARASPAAPSRLGPRRRRGQLRPPDLLDVGGRPDGGALLELPALRLRRPREHGQRPPRLLQGPRLAAAVRALQGRGRDRRRGAAHLPRVRLAPAGPPDAGNPLGRRRHRLARPGPADLGRHRARRRPARALRPAGLGALRRLRAGRGLDVGGLRARRLRRARQPDRDRRRQPARPARPDHARVGHLLAGRAGERLRLGRAGDRRPRPGGDRRRLRPGPGRRPPRRDLRPHQEGLRRRRGRGQGEPARQAARRPRGRGRGAGRHPLAQRRACAAPAAPKPFEIERTRGRAPRLRARREGRDPGRLRRRPRLDRLDRREGRRARRRGRQLDLRRALRRQAPGPLLRDVHRRAADGRRRDRHADARLEAVRLLVRRLPQPRLRLRPHGRRSPTPT